MRQIISFNNKNAILPAAWIPSGPANNEIWYTSSDGNIVTPYQASSLPTIVSNTYSDGKGIIKFDSDITIIGDQAFGWCQKLISMTIPNSVTSIGNSTFNSCGFTSINITDNVASIGSSAFYGCKYLPSVTIGNSVTSLGNFAFSFCNSLTSISYTGTISQWNAITKGQNWHYNVPATIVHCTDGDAPI